MRPTTDGVETDMPEDFPYGWRYVKVPGQDEPAQVPLTLEDVLHPQLGDVITERIHHNDERDYLKTAFRSRALGPPAVFVSSDLLTDFGVAGVRAMSPDTAVFVGLDAVPEGMTGLLELGVTGGRCALAAEVVSPDTRDNDVVHKHLLYHRVRVENYVIVDRWSRREPRVLSGYRWTPGGYEPIPLDEQGRLLVPVVNLLLRIDADDRLICEDPETGEEVGSYQRLHGDLAAMHLRDAEREQAMEDLVEKARQEARAKQDAEKRAAEKEEARLEAEKRAAEAAKARADAESRAAEKEKARLAAEERASKAESREAALLEEIARLRAAQPG
jgi:Uma2 family endonuclease